MLSKQEILDEINKTKEHLASLEKMAEEYKYEKTWVPKKGGYYYILTAKGDINLCINDSQKVLEDYLKTYNCFEKQIEAERELEKILVRRKLEDIAKRLNKSEEIDWCNLEQNKYYLSYDNYSRCGKICCVCNNNTVQGAVYCLDKNFLDVAKREIGEERLKKYILEA